MTIFASSLSDLSIVILLEHQNFVNIGGVVLLLV